jgi:hypothetical protein
MKIHEHRKLQPPVDYPIYAAVDNRVLRQLRRKKALDLFIAVMGITGWALLLLFLWVATP